MATLYEKAVSAIEHCGASDHVTATQVRNCFGRLCAALEGGPQPAFADGSGGPLCKADINKLKRSELDALAAKHNLDLGDLGVEDSREFLITELCPEE